MMINKYDIKDTLYSSIYHVRLQTALSLSPLLKSHKQWLRPPPVGNHTETRRKIVRQQQKNNLLTAVVGALHSNAAAKKKRQ